MPKVAEAPVTTRFLAPSAVEEATEDLLYQPVPQLEGDPPFKVKYRWFTPEQAAELLRHSDSDPEFRQRPSTTTQVRRWKNLIATKRFVHMLPNGVLCLDPDGIMLNGKHRMLAAAGGTQKVGFVVFENVPRWMFKYMDTGKQRTIKDVFHIGNRTSKAQTPSAMKLAMRYEEMLRGVRPVTGWRHWPKVSDEHNDVDGFFERRDEIQDWYGVAEKISRNAKLLIPSTLVFYFYQNLAWPEGNDQLQKFCESLMTNGGVPNSPVLVLREFARDAHYNGDKFPSKRELYLHLLFRAFELEQRGSRIPKIVWAYGNPMSMPYHPKGFEKAIENVRFALEEIDAGGMNAGIGRR